MKTFYEWLLAEYARIPIDMRQAIIDDYNNAGGRRGIQKELSVKYGLPPQTIRYIIKNPESGTPNLKYPADIRQAIIDDANNLHLTLAELVEKYGIQKPTIARYLKNNVTPEAKEKIKERVLELKRKHLLRFADKATLARQSPEHREKISSITTGLWQDPEFREKQLSKMQSPEYKARASEQMKELWKDKDFWTWLSSKPYDTARRMIAAMVSSPREQGDVPPQHNLIKKLDSIHPEKQLSTAS